MMENTRNRRGTVQSKKLRYDSSAKDFRKNATNKTAPTSVKGSTPAQSLTVVPNLQDKNTYQRLREEAESELRADKRNAQKSVLRSFLGIN